MNNINPKLWGPPAWDFLFYILASYPDSPTISDKENIKIFFDSLKNVLPCYSCRINYNTHLNKYPLGNNELMSRYNLINWLINVKNEINMSQNKALISYDDVINKYIYGNVTSFFYTYNKILTIVLIIVLIVILIYYAKSNLKD